MQSLSHYNSELLALSMHLAYSILGFQKEHAYFRELLAFLWKLFIIRSQVIFPKFKVVQFFRSDRERSAFGSLSRDCALITADSRHLVVVSTINVPENNSRIAGGIQKVLRCIFLFLLIRPFQNLIQNNESLLPNFQLEEFNFYSIDLDVGLNIKFLFSDDYGTFAFIKLYFLLRAYI